MACGISACALRVAMSQGSHPHRETIHIPWQRTQEPLSVLSGPTSLDFGRCRRVTVTEFGRVARDFVLANNPSTSCPPCSLCYISFVGPHCCRHVGKRDISLRQWSWAAGSARTWLKKDNLAAAVFRLKGQVGRSNPLILRRFVGTGMISTCRGMSCWSFILPYILVSVGSIHIR